MTLSNLSKDEPVELGSKVARWSAGDGLAQGRTTNLTASRATPLEMPAPRPLPHPVHLRVARRAASTATGQRPDAGRRGPHATFRAASCAVIRIVEDEQVRAAEPLQAVGLEGA